MRAALPTAESCGSAATAQRMREGHRAQQPHSPRSWTAQFVFSTPRPGAARVRGQVIGGSHDRCWHRAACTGWLPFFQLFFHPGCSPLDNGAPHIQDGSFSLVLSVRLTCRFSLKMPPRAHSRHVCLLYRSWASLVPVKLTKARPASMGKLGLSSEKGADEEAFKET